MFCLTETFHKKLPSNALFDNYNIIENHGTRQYIVGRPSLGYVIGIEHGFKYSVLYKDDYSCVLIISGTVLYFAYLPPDSTNSVFKTYIDQLNIFLERYKHYNFILMGDLNSRIGESRLTRSIKGLHKRVSKDI